MGKMMKLTDLKCTVCNKPLTQERVKYEEENWSEKTTRIMQDDWDKEDYSVTVVTETRVSCECGSYTFWRK